MSTGSPPDRPAVRLGPFTLEAPIGAGGMAEVWRAAHPSGARVAIKVMTNSLARSAEWRAGFMREIRATAGLDHPNIVRLYDCGVVPEAAAEVGLVPGSPWVAMAQATLGDLHDASPTHWGELRRVLFSVLDALAHAHARGVVHRDLKPANVLVSVVDGLADVWLTDFGIAHVNTEETALSTTPTSQMGSGGTPEYMAPEQVTGRIAEQGPWTDLYALGCLAYVLASGRAPYEGDSALAVAMQHVTGTAPPLVARYPVPVGFDGWVARLMAREPHSRYRCAADAAFALARLSDGFVHEARGDAVTLALSDTVAALHTMVLDVDDLDWPLAREGMAPQVRPPLPDTWHAASAEAPPFEDVGLGLLGVRRPPLIGRDAERDLLWERLHAAHAGAPARIVTLSGPRGVGTSALARWFCERAHAVGGAEIFEAQHQPIDTADDGIGAMLRRHFGAMRLSDEATDRHIGRAVPGQEGELLAQAARWWPGGPTHFESPDVRHAVVRRYLAERARQRPVVLFVDEAQWGGDTLTFVRALLREAVPGLLVVMAFDERGASISGTQSRSQWARLQRHPRCEVVALGPLTGPPHCALINSLLPLVEPLRHALHDHTGGNPRFTHDMLLRWVEADWLAPGPGGFALVDGVDDAWVPDIETLHLRRFERLVDHDEQAMQVLEVAAVLGVRVRSAEWVAICRALGLRLPTGLVDRLLRSGMVAPRTGGWAFDCDSAVQALRGRAREGERLAHANLVTARVLEARGLQVGHFLFRAGAYAEALPRILVKLRWLLGQSEYGAMLILMQFLRGPMDALGLEEADPRRLEARIMEARALRFVEGLEPAAAVLAELEPHIAAAPPHIAAQLVHLSASVAGPEVGYRERIRRYRDARDRYLTLGDRVGAADCMHGEGIMQMLLGHLALAQQCMHDAIEQARVAFERGADPVAQRTWAWATQGLSLVKTFQDDLTGADDAQAALAQFRVCGSRSGIGAAYHCLGEQALLRDDLDGAQAAFERAVAVLVAIDARLQVLARAGLVSVLVRRGLLDEAAERIADLDLAAADGVFDSSQMRARFHATAARVFAGLGRWADFDQHLGALEAFGDLAVISEAIRMAEGALPHLDTARWRRMEAVIAGWQQARAAAR